MKQSILIVDDEKNTRDGLHSFLKANYRIFLASDGKKALQILRDESIDLVMTDLRMPEMDGLTLLTQIRQSAPELPVILLTAYGSVETAVNAMKKGAYDYLAKPIHLDELEILVHRALSNQALKEENIQLRAQICGSVAFSNIIGQSGAMQKIFDLIRQVSDSKTTVLIQGKSGTGKELVARAIHFHGQRKDKPFIAVNCAALSESLLESELFGHEKGAFTGAVERKKGRFELASGGTLFLDEVGEMDPRIQVKLLRVLQEQEFERVGGTQSIRVDVRVICATNADLHALVADGIFREDLYFRINVMTVLLPELKDRQEDIPLLAKSFVDEFAKANQKRKLSIPSDLMDVLVSYSWPGNVRELRNCIERLVVLAKSNELSTSDLPLAIRNVASKTTHFVSHHPDAFNLADLEKTTIQKALAKTKQNKTKAAKLLGLSRRTLHRKLNEYGLSV